MAQITRVFDSSGRAQAALDELKAKGFADAELTPAADQKGRTVLRVEAPFGTGLKVEAILNRHAEGSAPAAPQGATAASGAAAPPAAEPQAAARIQTATARLAPVKSATPARNGSHDGVRSGPRTLSQWLGIPELIDSDTFFSGFPLLIRPTPKLTGESTRLRD